MSLASYLRLCSSIKLRYGAQLKGFRAQPILCPKLVRPIQIFLHVRGDSLRMMQGRPRSFLA